MSPIEYLWIVIVVLFGFVGVVRGYTKELGVTTMCVAGLLLVMQFGNQLILLLRTNMGDNLTWMHTASFGAGFNIGVFLIIVFISYQGVTLNFKGVVEGSVNVHALIVLIGGVFIIYTAMKEIFHMLSVEEIDKVNGDAKRTVGGACFGLSL